MIHFLTFYVLEAHGVLLHESLSGCCCLLSPIMIYPLALLQIYETAGLVTADSFCECVFLYLFEGLRWL